MTFEMIARVAHEAIKGLREGNMDNSMAPWDRTDDDGRFNIFSLVAKFSSGSEVVADGVEEEIVQAIHGVLARLVPVEAPIAPSPAEDTVVAAEPPTIELTEPVEDTTAVAVDQEQDAV